MAYVADFITKANAVKATTLAWATTDLPPHVLDDYLILAITCEAEVVVAITASVGWTQIGTTIGNGATATGLYSAMFYKKCAGAAESCTLTLSVTNAVHSHAFLIKDADTTTFLDAVSSVNVATAEAFTSASVTTTVADTLLLYYIGIDSTTITPTMCHTAPSAVHFLDSSDNGGANVTAGSKVMAGAACGWYFQRAAGATPTPKWDNSLTAMTNRFTVSIRNKIGGVIPPYIDDAAVIGTKVMAGHQTSATAYDNELFKATPLSVVSFITHLGTLTGTYDAVAAAPDSHLNAYSNAISSTPAISATALTGFELQIPTTAIDMTTGWLVGTVMESTPKQANWGTGTIKTGGLFIIIGSTTNYRSFQVLASDNLINTEGRAVFSIQANQTQTQSGQSATPPTISGINRIWVLNRGNLAPLVQYHCDYHLLNKIVAAGGTAATPVDSEGLYNIGRFLRVKVIQKQGAAGLLPLIPVQIGGGDAVNFQIDAGSMQFPRIYDRSKREINYHGANNAIGISYAGKSGDVIKHTNSVVTSASPYYWEINVAATAAATWDFSGLVVVNASVTLRPVLTFDSLSFSACTITATNASVLVSCVFSKCPEITGAGASLSTCTLSAGSGVNSVLSITASTQALLQAELNKLASNNFINNVTPLGALRIIYTGTAGAISLNLSSNTFSGNTKDIRWEAPAASNLTMNLSGTANPTTYSATNANTVTFSNPKTKTFTNIPSGAEIRIKVGSFTLAYQASIVSGSYLYNYQADSKIATAVVSLAGLIIDPIDFTQDSTSSSIAIVYSPDPSYV